MKQLHPIQRFFSKGHPITEFVSLEFEGIRDGVLTVGIRPSDAFVFEQKSNVLHSGMATLVLDSVMGGTVMGELEQLQPIATAGLTVQHLRRPQLGEYLQCQTVFMGIHNDLAHVNAQLVVKDTQEVLSTATGTFMIGTRSKPLGVRV